MRECFVTIVLCGNLSLSAAADMSKMILRTLGIPIVLIPDGGPTSAFTQAPHLALQVKLSCRIEIHFFFLVFLLFTAFESVAVVFTC